MISVSTIKKPILFPGSVFIIKIINDFLIFSNRSNIHTFTPII